MAKQNTADKTQDQTPAAATDAKPDDATPGTSPAPEQHTGAETQAKPDDGASQENPGSPAVVGPDDVVVDIDAPYGRRADGTPAAKRGPKTSDATLQERSAQRAKLKSVTPSTAKPKPGAGATVTALAVVNYQAMGEAVASLWFNGGAQLLGEGWLPDVAKGEPQAVAGAFRDYFKATNARDLPPSLGLAFVLSVYTLSHMQTPSVKTRLQRFGQWVKEKMPKRGVKYGV